MEKLTLKQLNFCKEYVVNGGNGKQAYFKAYPNTKKDRTAESNAYILLRKHEVKQEIERLQSELDKKALLTALERQKILASIVLSEDEKTSNNDRMKAIDILNKMEGSYIEKIELKEITCKWSKG